MDDWSYADDPVLRLHREVPDSFLRLAPDEQMWRGRFWLTLFGAGYEIDHAWWFALADESVIADQKAMVATVPDDHFPLMV